MDSIIALEAAVVSLMLIVAILRICIDVRRIRLHFDRVDKANKQPAPVSALAAFVSPPEPEATPARRPAFVPPPIRTPDPVR